MLDKSAVMLDKSVRGRIRFGNAMFCLRLYCIGRVGKEAGFSTDERKDHLTAMAARASLGIMAGMIAGGLTLADAGTQVADESLTIYAVNVVQHPPQSWTGYGIYLGNGLVITAAHVVGSAARTRPSIRIAELELPAQTIKEASFEKMRLTLLAIDQTRLPISLQMGRMPHAGGPPYVGQPVIVAVPESIARSQIVSPQVIPARWRFRFSTAIRDVATTGNSGSGVFDAAAKCLLGIMSRKFVNRDAAGNEHDIAKYFVPADVIEEFIPSKYRF
jgi:hypothetical protein